MTNFQRFALPLSIISSNFGRYETYSKQREKIIRSLKDENNDAYPYQLNRNNEIA